MTVEEDAELRRLHALAAFGQLGPEAAALYEELRARDRRDSVREPVDVVMAHPRSAAHDELADEEEPVAAEG